MGRLYQTMDLASIQDDHPLAPKLSMLFRLRAQLYSPEFRNVVQHITGSPPLTDRVDMVPYLHPLPWSSLNIFFHKDTIFVCAGGFGVRAVKSFAMP